MSEQHEPPAHKPVPDDVDPRYGTQHYAMGCTCFELELDRVFVLAGLHGYICTVELRNHKTSLWSEQFRDLNAADVGETRDVTQA